MIRVTILVHSLRLGGTEVQVSALARGLDSGQFALTVVSFHADGILLDELRDAGVAVVTVGKRGRWDVLGFLWRVIMAVRRSRPDVVYSFLDLPNVVGMAARIFGATPRLIWGMRASDMRLHERGRSWRAIFAIERHLARFADLIICNAWAGRSYLRDQGFPVENMTVVANGIDTTRFVPRPQDRQKVRQDMSLADDDFAIGIVARLDPIKDHRTYLQAAHLLSHSAPRARFVIVGDGAPDVADGLRRMASERGLDDRVIWAGARSDMPAVYSAFDIATLTSQSEGFPNVVGEAMACGLPCVVTDAGDAGMMVAGTGAMVPVRDAAQLSQAWERFLRMPESERLERGRAAMQHIRTHFPRDVMISETARRLETVAKGERPAPSGPHQADGRPE